MRLLLLAIVVVPLFACASPDDPFDPAAIERDLRDRTPQDVFDAARKLDFNPPAQRCITHKQIVDLIRMQKLAARIRDVAERRLGEEADRAEHATSRTARATRLIAAVGIERSWATADLRAALDLGLNPSEMQWVARQIDATLPAIKAMRNYDDTIDQDRSELDATADPYVIPSKQAQYDTAVQAKQKWEEAQGELVMANAAVILQHGAELKELYPSFDWR